MSGGPLLIFLFCRGLQSFPAVFSQKRPAKETWSLPLYLVKRDLQKRPGVLPSRHHCPPNTKTTSHCPPDTKTMSHCPPNTKTVSHCPPDTKTMSHYPPDTKTMSHCPSDTKTMSRCPPDANSCLEGLFYRSLLQVSFSHKVVRRDLTKET